MSRLVIVSNCVADPQCETSDEFAFSILQGLRERGGVWFGWNGSIVADESEISIAYTSHDNVTMLTMPLTEREFREFFLGYCNEGLWPVFHYRLDLARFTQENSESYRRVNNRFAELLAPLLRQSDLVWVQDYHLIAVAAGLRARGLDNRIGFFLHIPFPPPDVLVAMPEYEWLINTMLEYDVIGFQTKTDHANFCRFVFGFMGGELLSHDTLIVSGKRLTVAVFPVGIDVDRFVSMAQTPEAETRIQRLHRRGEARVNIIGVDRLDYSKGLPDRLRAFKRFLELFPHHQKAVTLMQIAPPAREDIQAYIDIRHELEALSGEINGEFGDYDWTPVRYVRRNLAEDTLAALYRGSHVGLVTPLRDGMNLVAKAYTASQDANDPGVLVLSRFAGAAEDLAEALIVNPYDADEVAQAIQHAIVMPQNERIERHRALMSRIRARDEQNWVEGFLATLGACRGQDHLEPATSY